MKAEWLVREENFSLLPSQFFDWFSNEIMTSLMVRWLRIFLTMEGTLVRSLVPEDPHMLWRNWVHVLQLLKPTPPKAHALQQGKTPQWEAHTLQLESNSCSLQLEKSPHSNEDAAQPKINRWKFCKNNEIDLRQINGKKNICMESPKICDSEKWPKQTTFMPFRPRNNTFVKNWQNKGVQACICVKSLQLCPTLWDHMDWNPLVSSVFGLP